MTDNYIYAWKLTQNEYDILMSKGGITALQKKKCHIYLVMIVDTMLLEILGEW